MTEKIFEETLGKFTATNSSIESILQWATHAASTTPQDDVVPLLSHLRALQGNRVRIPAEQRAKLLDLLHSRYVEIQKNMHPVLSACGRPVARNVRRAARNLQEIQWTMAESYDSVLREMVPSIVIPDADVSPQRVIALLCDYLVVSYVTAAPVRPGVWQMVHSAYQQAVVEGEMAERLLRQYLSVLALACTQPTTLSAHEVYLAYRLIELYGETIHQVEVPDIEDTGLFWLLPEVDCPPLASGGKTPAKDRSVFFFSTLKLGQRVEQRYRELCTGGPTDDLSSFEFSEHQIAAVHRLANQWINPAKRRFHRRRHNYRAQLCIGFNDVWNLYAYGPDHLAGEPSDWMVLNESPDGYGIMHISGSVDRLDTGSLVAFSSAGIPGWQLCIVRWQLSENPEHLEVGLQILATHIIPARLGIPVDDPKPELAPVLLLPPAIPLRKTPLLVIEPGYIGTRGGRIILVIDRHRLEIREYREVGLLESLRGTEILSIVRDDILE